MIFGVAHADDRTGVTWLISARHPTHSVPVFVRAARSVVAAMAEAYPRLTNMVDRRHRLYRRGFALCGFTLLATLPCQGRDGADFDLFGIARAA